MPLVYQQNINASTKLGVWQIDEPESFFLEKVSVQREITHPNKRLQHLAGRYLLKELFPDFPYELIRIADTRKPFLQNEAYHFSISHSSAYAAVIISTHYRVGVDVELISNKAGRVKHKFLSDAEQSLLSAIPSLPATDISESLLTAAWCIKESLYKWKGSSEIDFKKHLRLISMNISSNKGIAHCSVLKDGAIDLPVHFLLFGKNCISWVFTAVE